MDRFVSQNGIGTGIVTMLNEDIHGARKVENGEVYFVVDNVASDGTAFSLKVSGLIRMLVKLP